MNAPSHALGNPVVPDSESLRQRALNASWRRDRRVSRRRLWWRWTLWALARFGLPLALALAAGLWWWRGAESRPQAAPSTSRLPPAPAAAAPAAIASPAPAASAGSAAPAASAASAASTAPAASEALPALPGVPLRLDTGLPTAPPDRTALPPSPTSQGDPSR